MLPARIHRAITEPHPNEVWLFRQPKRNWRIEISMRCPTSSEERSGIRWHLVTQLPRQMGGAFVAIWKTVNFRKGECYRKRKDALKAARDQVAAMYRAAEAASVARYSRHAATD